MSAASTIITTEQTAFFQKAVDFIQSIGIPVLFKEITGKSFLPGISIESGEIVVDPEKLKYPGDILHEAGHIAVVPSAERALLNETTICTRPMREAEEMMSIAWSYAACVHLDIDAGFVFHNEGYQKGGSDIAVNFKEGRYFGVPMLQWTGMALEKTNPEHPEIPVYPQMLKWARD
ncbi:MAG: hypothetical protein IPG86_08890 [Chitinophagaceae bacterium]|nr:hypothetical protein [Chitinophagaceae bacterium]